MQLNTLSSNTKRAPSRRVGRGGKRGKTSGRGTKGQKARAGHRLRPEIRDRIKKLPKRRGYRLPSIATKAFPLSLTLVAAAFQNGDNVNPKTLAAAHLLGRSKGKLLAVKILGTGPLDKKLVVSKCLVSATAKEAIEKAGGSVA